MAYAKGYDVSDYQTGIPGDASFVFIKASEGAHTAQLNWREKQAAARARGLVVGYYHFFHAENDVGDEVAHFCGAVGDVPEDELLVLDFEPYDQGVDDAECTRRKNAWLAAVKARYPNHKVGMYTNRDWWFRTDDECGDFLWIADYETEPGAPRIRAAWRFHQHTEDPLDTDVFGGSEAELRAWVRVPAPSAGPEGGVPPPASATPTVPGARAAPPPADDRPAWERLVAHVLSVPEGDYEHWDDEEGWDNHTRFGRQFGEDGVAWCVIFEWCMYDDLGLTGIVPKTDNVDSFTQWARARGQWSEYPSLGAWMNWRDGSHTEIVVAFTPTTVTTKGGNTLPAGGDGGQGRGVYSHTYQRTDSRITGYFAPRFTDTGPPTADPHDPRGGPRVGTSPAVRPAGGTGGTPATSRSRKMALVSKTVPSVVGDDSATVFTAVPGSAWINVSADYVPPGEKVSVRIDVADGRGTWVQTNQIRTIGNGEAAWLELAAPEFTRVVSVKRLSHQTARLDATLHYPDS
ncbi:glycoside hydrolase family 25 protein [Yinghuangia seranimata]|uniref:glycoside hydrolase family 25 protein n=1 Tax=Yinghuangia seranimata TaxID=408067 RepID=UPI00248BE69F|nr:glycoside hydrolase family 25 protein [Yinghuangia seranimata]MDI2124921.1 glycoside hydrolase family 25 protein [Yinghuangia seranimata]